MGPVFNTVRGAKTKQAATTGLTPKHHEDGGSKILWQTHCSSCAFSPFENVTLEISSDEANLDLSLEAKKTNRV